MAAYPNMYQPYQPYQDRMQMNQYQPVPQPMAAPTNNQGILWVQGESGAKSYLVAPGSCVLLMDSEAERFFIKSTDVSGMPQPLRVFEYHEINGRMPQKQPEAAMNDMYVTRKEYQDLFNKYNEILDKRGAQAALCGMSPEFAAQIFEHIHEESVRQQLEILNQK